MAWQEQQSCLLADGRATHSEVSFKSSTAAPCLFIFLFHFVASAGLLARHRSNLPTFSLMVHLAATGILTATPEARRHVFNINLISDI